jgi:hypothetical protein
MGPLDNETMKGLEKELEGEVKGMKTVEKRKLLSKCADYLLLEDKSPLERMEKKEGYNP